ncbi:glycosyltransferase family 4 protein [Pseudothioclava nitratireducens]|uniref:glycosyltransferase family 4 protein n=1 Tax=Pseudothioclava nitratireducens TaxID=1928646 RepID=UPI0023DA07C8|nr:glycosyltransferase family 4 protein [Defluviimonas nitratireducens]MDF1621762.1 glycosyltransferase family 4 protein [Defluviimonas nitratireducens]
MKPLSINACDVIAPNFKRRLSGVTSTIVRLVPLQAKTINILSIGGGLPPHVPKVSFMRLLTMSRRGPSGPRVWHARRNIEMIGGLFLKHVLRKHLKLLFTSASQRHHTKLTKALIRRMDRVVSTSRKTASFLERDSTVILHGIDTETFCPPPNKAEVRTTLGLPETGFLVGCYGRIRAQKGTDVFVDAMIKVVEAHHDCTGIVMGRATSKDVDYENDLKRRVKKLGLSERIRFVPEVPVWDMPSWYQCLDVYVAPQRWEGFGLTPLEAMACAVPVVATRVGAFEELVLDGVTGALIAPSDSTAMAQKLRSLLDDPYALQKASAAARAHVMAEFQIQKEAAALINVYRQMLN